MEPIGAVLRHYEGLLAEARPTSWVEAGERLNDLVAAGGFDHASYLSLRPDPTAAGGLLYVTTFPAAWCRRYIDRGYVEIDPVVRLARERVTPFDWAEIEVTTPETVRFVAEALAGGIGPYGLTLPMHGADGEAALFSVTGHGDAADWRERCRVLVPHLLLFGWEFHRGVEELRRAGEASAAMPSPREIEVLRWAASGKTVKETSRVLGLSTQTVESYIRDAVRRLGCRNKTQAVAEAVRRRLI